MANLLYPKCKEALLKADLDFENDTIKAVLIDVADYTFDSTHDFLNDVPVGARVGAPQTLASKTVTNGVFDAADISFPTVTGDAVEAILVYQDSGAEATSRLIALIDQAAGLPKTPSGANINVSWPFSGIFSL